MLKKISTIIYLPSRKQEFATKKKSLSYKPNCLTNFYIFNTCVTGFYMKLFDVQVLLCKSCSDYFCAMSHLFSFSQHICQKQKRV